MKRPRISFRVAAALGLVLLTACKGDMPPLYDPLHPEIIDPSKKLTREDYARLQDTATDGNVSFKTAGAPDGGPPIPELAPILAAPSPPKLGQTKLVSIAVTDDVPLKDVLLELGRLADVDMEIDPAIAGGVAFRAKDKPFNEVVERIADLAGLRYKMKDGILRIERDMPYLEVYPIDFINIDRSTQSTVNVSTNVLSGGGSNSGSGTGSSQTSTTGTITSNNNSNSGSGSGNSGLNTGSQSSITAKSDSDFWKQFEDGIRQILLYKPAKLSSAAASTQARAGTPATPGQPPAAAVTAPGIEERTFYIMNRQGGTLTVAGTEKQHELIGRFIKKMVETASAQVLIEAKIVEVTLNQQFQSGIDWNKLGTNRYSFVSTFGGVTDPANIATFATKASNLGGINLDLDLAVRLTEAFGTTRTLSSPRLHAINNQQAVLTFAENQVYFQLNVDRETTTSTVQNTTLTVNSEIKTVPIGIILMIQPAINTESDEVTLNVRPTLSRVTGFVSDPAVAFLVAQANATGTTVDIDSKVPVVEVRELDSILKLKSGQVMVIGGLMEDKSLNTDSGMPYVSSIPVVGQLFKGTDRSNTVKELVIFIRATIIDSSGYAHAADKAVYEKFTHDPRPLNF